MQGLEYRTSFLLSIVANALDFIFGLVQYALFFSAAKTIAGWGMDEMLAFYAVFMIVFSLHFILLFPNLSEMAQLVYTGQLDLVLTKPVSAQLFLSFRRLSFEEFGSLFAALFLLLGLIGLGRVRLSISSVAAFTMALTCSFVLVYSLFLFLLALAIRLERLQHAADLLWTLFGLARYPVDVFPRWLRLLMYGLLPIAFVTTVPARMLTTGPEIPFLGVALVLAGIGLCTATWFWRRSLHAYSSAGG